jgi:hypothetical protein
MCVRMMECMQEAAHATIRSFRMMMLMSMIVGMV